MNTIQKYRARMAQYTNKQYGKQEAFDAFASLEAQITALKEQLQQGRVTKRFAELSDENARYKKALEAVDDIYTSEKPPTCYTEDEIEIFRIVHQAIYPNWELEDDMSTEMLARVEGGEG